MEPWQQRVVEERGELSDRIVKLNLFLNGESVSALPHEDYLLLTNQYAVMVLYHDVLDRRIARFNGKNT